MHKVDFLQDKSIQNTAKWNKRRFGGFTLLLLLCSCFLTGCGGDPHNRDDVEEYVREELGIKQFTVSREAKEYSPDKVWTVTLRDGSNRRFHVQDGYVEGLFSGSYSLWDDYDAVMAACDGEKALAALAIEEHIFMECDEDEQGMAETTFRGDYTDRTSLEQTLEDMGALAAYMQSTEQPCKVDLLLRFMHPLREASENVFYADDADLHVWQSGTLTEERKEEAFSGMILMSMDYDYKEILEDVTEEEIREAIAASSSCIGICHGDPKMDEYVYYEDICGSIYGGTVSYPTFYHILEREGYAVAGDAWHYTFTGIDGSEYEISYSAEDPEEIYCLQDGEIREGNYYAHFSQYDMRTLTGLQVMIWKMDYQPNADKKTEEGRPVSIDSFYLNGEEMTYSEVREGYFLNTTEDYKHLIYNRKWNAYLIPVDIGLHEDNMSYPVIWQEWVKALGGTYAYRTPGLMEKIRFSKQNTGHGLINFFLTPIHLAKDLAFTDVWSAEWEIDGDQYIMTAAYRDNRVTKVELKKNRELQNINWIGNGDDGYTGAAFCLALPVEEFAELLNLEYTIDESEGRVDFICK